MIPKRMCVICRQMKIKNELIRLVRTPEGVVIDSTFKAQGRGAYICNLKECINQARRRRALERSFSCAVGSEIYDCLEELIAHAK